MFRCTHLYGKVSQGTQSVFSCLVTLLQEFHSVSGTEDERVVSMNPKLKEGRRQLDS